MQTAFFAQNNHGAASGSAFNSKRKRSSWCVEEFEYEQAKHMRVRSPGLDRRTTFPLAHGVGAGAGPGNHVNGEPGSGAQRSDGSEADGDMDMDGDADASDMGMPLSMPVPMHLGGVPALNMPIIGGVGAPQQEAERQQHNYSFAASGSGGFGFGPGAEEDDDEDEMGKEYNTPYPTELYPSFTPHTNPNHFSNQHHNAYQPTTLRPKSPLSAQPFTTSLRAPGSVEAGGGGGIVPGFAYGGSGGGGGGGGAMAQFALPPQPTLGLMQPTVHAPLPEGASEIDKARAQHGPQCRSIPKLVLSPYPDAVTGKQSMWTMCPDCGAVERSS